MRGFFSACIAVCLGNLGHAQELDISEIVAAQTAYDESQTETRRTALLRALSNYQDDATVETVNAHLIVMSNDVASGDYEKMRESAVAATAHLAPVAEFLPQQYIEAKFVGAISLFNGEEDASAMLEMAHVEGFTGRFREPGFDDRPVWAINIYWKATAWTMAMDAYFETAKKDHPSEDEINAVLANYKVDTETLNAAAKASEAESALPFCDGRVVQSPQLRYPARSMRKGMVGAVIMGMDFDTGGKVLNPKVLASIPSDEFDESLLRTVSKWRYRAKKRKDVGVTCRVDRTNIVIPFIFTLE